jgi:hypothetical protein
MVVTNDNDEIVRLWFPKFLFLATVDVDWLVKEVGRHISKHASEHIGGETIRDTLKEFFRRFRSIHLSRSEWLYETLGQTLWEDIRGTQRSGLKESRQKSVILGCLAGIASSNRLAGVLISFLSKHIFAVVEHEQPGHLREWGLTLHELCGLGYEPILVQLASHLTRPGPAIGYGWSLPNFHDPREENVRKALADAQRLLAADYHRGRRQNGRLRLPGWVWARSARAYPHHHHTAVGFHLPRMSRAAVPFGCFDESDDWEDLNDYKDLAVVRVQQHLQAAEVDQLERRVRILENRY